MTTQQAAWLHANSDIEAETLEETPGMEGHPFIGVAFMAIFEACVVLVGAIIWRLL